MIDNYVSEEEAMEESVDITEVYPQDDFQVVRAEFLPQTKKYSVSFSKNHITVSTACLKRFPEIELVEILLNRKAKKMILRPITEEEKDSLLWCSTKDGKRKTRKVNVKYLFDMLFTMMGWDRNCRYKLVGSIAPFRGEKVLFFDLTSKQQFIIGAKDKVNQPIFPKEWENQFGQPFSEHQKATQIGLFDEYKPVPLKEQEGEES